MWWQFEGGLGLTSRSRTDGEAYFAHGESDTYNRSTATPLTRWRALVTQNDYGRNAKISETRTVSVASARRHLAIGLLTYSGATRPSQIATAVEAKRRPTPTISRKSGTELPGGLFDPLAGEAAVRRATSRKNWSGSPRTSCSRRPRSPTGDRVTRPATRRFDFVRDYYAELLIPVVSDPKF
jgi:hypothetical protein